MKTLTTERIIWLDPECNEWDRREWESLWSLDELQAGVWSYRGTIYSGRQWQHGFEQLGQPLLQIQAYSLWVRMRSPQVGFLASISH